MESLCRQPVKRQRTIGSVFRQMWFAPFFAIAGFWLSRCIISIVTIAVAFPFLVAWFCAPFIVWYISRPSADKKTEVSDEQIIYLRKLARKYGDF